MVFNPECRKRILETNWEKSLYIHYLDVDFVLGRLVENEKTPHGEMRGGLLLAYLKPDRRSLKLEINQTGKEIYEKVSQYLE